MKRILIGQLNNLGDCLLATTVAKQIKSDFPNSRLTWAISTACKYILINNQYVDEIWEIPLSIINESNVIQQWREFVNEAEIRKIEGKYDLIFYTQYSYGHLCNYSGITRASIFAGYKNKITVDKAPVINLTESEIQNVRNFILDRNIRSYKKVILFECSASSNQTFLNDDYVYEFCDSYAKENPSHCIILSSYKKYNIKYLNVINANMLSFRENAELLNFCDLFIGCSSGISWLSTSAWSKVVPKIILISQNCPQASMILDHKYYKLPIDHITELVECSPSALIGLIKYNGDGNSVDGVKFSNFSFNNVLIYKPISFYFSNCKWRQVIKLFSNHSAKYRLEVIRYILLLIYRRFKPSIIKK